MTVPPPPRNATRQLKGGVTLSSAEVLDQPLIQNIYWESIVGLLNPNELLAPRDRIGECQAAESALKILTGSLTLSVGLGMKTWRQTRRGPDLSTEFLPKTREKLRTPIRDQVNRKTMDPEDMVNNQLTLGDSMRNSTMTCSDCLTQKDLHRGWWCGW